MLIFIILGATFALSTAYYQIDDIPIEHFDFEHGDLRNSDMDIELMPRFQKSVHISEMEEDPKEYFFSSAYSQYGDSYFEKDPSSEESSEEEESGERKKREVTDSSTPVGRVNRKRILTTLGKPLELSVIDPGSITEKTEDGVVVALDKDKDSHEKNNLLINDFIRFKRSAATEKMNEDVVNVKKLMDNIEKEIKDKPTDSKEDPKSLVEEVHEPHTEKLVMNNRDNHHDRVRDHDHNPDRDQDFDHDMARETRGATKEQWVKQMYPVRRREELEDNSALPAEKEVVRAPRVHFVTQGMADSSPRPEYNRYDREGRVRSLNKELSWNLDRDPYRNMEYYYQPRYTRHYHPAPPPYSSYRNERYYNHDSRDPYSDYPPRNRYRGYPEKPYDNYDNHNSYNSHNNYSGSKAKQKRIIYYATLPEISRTPPNVNLRDRYDYRERYDNRYFSPESSYQMRKPYSKSRYEETDSRKPQYPLKVSTDVNVREVKKNPEGRVYSDVDRSRFPQNTNYRNDRGRA